MQVINITYGAAGGPSPEDVAKMVSAAVSVAVRIGTRGPMPRGPMPIRLNACDVRRGPYAPCVCCGRMTPCLMDPTMSGVVRPWCMWHAVRDAGPVKGYPVRLDRWLNQPNSVAWERQHRRLANAARRRAASHKA